MKTAVSLHMKSQHLTVSIDNQCLDHKGAEPYPVLKLIQADGDVTMFPEYDQIMQIYATLGAFIAENPQHFGDAASNVAEERVTLQTYGKCFSVPRVWLDRILDEEAWGDVDDYLLECTYDDNEWIAKKAEAQNVYKYVRNTEVTK